MIYDFLISIYVLMFLNQFNSIQLCFGVELISILVLPLVFNFFFRNFQDQKLNNFINNYYTFIPFWIIIIPSNPFFFSKFRWPITQWMRREEITTNYKGLELKLEEKFQIILNKQRTESTSQKPWVKLLSFIKIRSILDYFDIEVHDWDNWKKLD